MLFSKRVLIAQAAAVKIVDIISKEAKLAIKDSQNKQQPTFYIFCLPVA